MNENNAPILIDKVKWDGVKVRIEYQQRRQDNRYDELSIASFDRPSPEFVAALQALELDVCTICELPTSYTEGLQVRGVSFTYHEETMGACITALKTVKSAKSPLCINTPFITEGAMNDQDHGPFFDEETIERLQEIVLRAGNYVSGGERAQGELDLKTPQPADPPSGDVAAASALRSKDCAEYARLMGIDLAQALTDPANPVIREFAAKFKNCSFEAGGRRLSIDGAGNLTVGPV